TPLKVALSPKGEHLVLYLRLKNISAPDNGGRLEFNPLPAKFAEVDPKHKDQRPYVYLEAGAKRLYGARVQWLKGPVGAGKPADPVLGPGEEMTVMLTTL